MLTAYTVFWKRGLNIHEGRGGKRGRKGKTLEKDNKEQTTAAHYKTLLTFTGKHKSTSTFKILLRRQCPRAEG